MRRRWQMVQRLKQLRDDPLMPLVYLGLIGILAYLAFVYNMLTHQW